MSILYESLEFKNTNCFCLLALFHPFEQNEFGCLNSAKGNAIDSERKWISLLPTEYPFGVQTQRTLSISFMVTVRANYFQDLLCTYVLTLLDSEINTIIKGPFPYI